MKKKIGIGADHAGFELKEVIISYLKNKDYEIIDYGAYSGLSSNYAYFGHLLAEAVTKGEVSAGISLCGSGNGISMTVNKHPGIRSAVCWNDEISKLARLHNDANICALPARFIDIDLAKRIVDTFLETGFEGGRHELRIKAIPLKK